MEQIRNTTTDRLVDKQPWMDGPQFICSLESVRQFHIHFGADTVVGNEAFTDNQP